jgi:hypothetical protein
MPPFSDIYAFGIPRAFLTSVDEHMRSWKFLAFLTLSVVLLGMPGSVPAQVAIQMGPEPVCPYGYYDFAPYHCAPYGYYGPEWFSGGVFIGAGPWFHGPHDFHGHVDNHFDPHHGYHGPFPERGDRPFNHFHGNEMRDGHGHAVGGHR